MTPSETAGCRRRAPCFGQRARPDRKRGGGSKKAREEEEEGRRGESSKPLPGAGEESGVWGLVAPGPKAGGGQRAALRAAFTGGLIQYS